MAVQHVPTDSAIRNAPRVSSCTIAREGDNHGKKTGSA